MTIQISIIIATFNRCRDLSNTLDSLLKQKFNGRIAFEVIVVDNNSQDDTPRVVETFVGRFSKSGAVGLRYILEKQKGKPFAVNAGIAAAQGDILAFTDDDVIVEETWLMNLTKCFESTNCDGVGGRVLPVYPDQTPAWIRDNPHQAAGTVVIYDYGDGTRPYDLRTMDLFIGANYAFRRKVFQVCGNFRTDLVFGKVAVGEDHEFLRRIIVKYKKVLYYCGSALVHHPVDLKRSSLKRMALWHIALGNFAARIEGEEDERKIGFVFRVPRYIFKQLVKSLFLMIMNLFNRMLFLKHFRSFFVYIGMIQEYRSQPSKS